MAANQLGSEPSAVRPRFQLSWRVAVRQPVRVIDPAIESHYGSGYERSRLFPGGTPSLEFVRSMDLLERLLPAPPARVLDVGGGPGAYAAPLAQRGYRVHVVDPVPLPPSQRRAACSQSAAGYWGWRYAGSPRCSTGCLQPAPDRCRNQAVDVVLVRRESGPRRQC